MARQTEAQMIDDERFRLIYSVLGAATVIGMKPDSRIPRGIPMSAGYVQGVPRLGVPAQLQTDVRHGDHERRRRSRTPACSGADAATI